MIPEVIVACPTPQFDNVGIVAESQNACGWYTFCQLEWPEYAAWMRPCLVAIASEAMYENDTIWDTR